jgi:uncharacterized membrane protein YgcG
MTQRRAAFDLSISRTTMKRILLAAALSLCTQAVPAQPDSDPVASSPPAKSLGTDRNRDGKMSRTEVTPGSAADKRFDKRDLNHDGQLGQDEYYMPPGSGGNVSGRNNPPANPNEPASTKGHALQPGPSLKGSANAGAGGSAGTSGGSAGGSGSSSGTSGGSGSGAGGGGSGGG